MMKAANYHKKYITQASQAKGCDRHLFGLKTMLKDNEVMPDLFTDPSYAKAMTYGLSTSQLGVNTHEYAIATGFGSAVPNGYGLNYFIGPESVTVGIECKRSPVLNKIQDNFRMNRFKQAWMETMRDMKELIEKSQVESNIQFKSSGWWYQLPEQEEGNSAYPRISKL